MGRLWAAVFLLLIVVTIIPGHVSCLEENDLDQILYINSYDFDFSWSKLMADGVHDGIISGLNESEKPGVYVLTEFMDSKFISDDIHFRNLYNLYSYKLKGNKPGVIIVSDDNALRFMREYGDEMFPGVPVVFTGINDYDWILDDLPANYTGIIEKTPIEENIDLVLRLHPDLNTIYFVTDDTFTGKTVRRQTENITKKYEDRIEVRYSGQGLSTGEMLREVQELPDNSAVIFFTYSILNENGDKMYPDRYIITLMNQNRIPVYTVMDQYNKLGVSGGYQISAYELGKAASEKAMKIINGTDPNDIPVETETPSKIELNYDDIKKYDIKGGNIPPETEFFNKPSYMVAIPKNIATAIVILILSLAAILLISLFYNNRLKKTEIELKDSLDEKNILLREIHHRVKNNLAVITSLVEMQSMNSTETETKQKLRDMGNRIISMSIIYDNLYQSGNLSKINIRTVFMTLGEKLIQDYSMGIDVHFEVAGEDCLISPDKAVPLSLAINEIIGNSLKFAFAGKKTGEIRINYTCKDDILNIRIADNGIGIDRSYIEGETESIGLGLIRNIVSLQLNGTAEIRSDGGTIWIICFPADNN